MTVTPNVAILTLRQAQDRDTECTACAIGVLTLSLSKGEGGNAATDFTIVRTDHSKV